jgi:hypothetical protein
VSIAGLLRCLLHLWAQPAAFDCMWALLVLQLSSGLFGDCMFSFRLP